MADIHIVPLKFSNTTLLNSVVNELQKNFKSAVKLLPLDLSIDNAFSRERNQYYSTQILSDVIGYTNPYNGKILSLTEVDLFVPVLTFIFGEAQLNGKHSIMSVCRLHEEFYSAESNDELLLDRTMKEVLHELGHNFGLRHCMDWDCVMHASLGIEEVDVKGSSFCRSCAKSVDGYKRPL